MERYLQATGIWYDNEQNCIVSSKRVNSTYFPSKAEFQFYLYLKEITTNNHIEIKVHPKVSTYGRTWAVDFALIATNSNAEYLLAALNNKVNNTKFGSLQKLYIEYKGIQDKNFISKMSHFCIQSPLLASTIILVSAEVGAFGCERTIPQGIILKPIVSVNTFKKWFDGVIVQTQY